MVRKEALSKRENATCKDVRTGWKVGSGGHYYNGLGSGEITS